MRLRPFLRPFLLVLLLALAVFLLAPAAGAHTDFESSDPPDGAVLDRPVETVTVVFTAAAEPAGDGFQVLDPAGEPRAPSSVTSEDGRTWVLRFAPPLADGVVGVRWSVRAGDAHPIDGSFSFTAGTAPESATTAAPTTLPGADSAATTGSTTSPPPTTTPAESEALEEFLEADDGTTAADVLAALGRILGLLGAVVGLGAAAFTAWVLRGDRSEIAMVLAWVRRGAVLVVAGTLLQLAGEVVLADSGDWAGLVSTSAWRDVLGSTLGVALLLSIAGAALLGIGARPTARHSGAAAPSPNTRTGAERGAVEVSRKRSVVRTWKPTATAVLGAILLLASFLFDGHTVTEGNRVLHSVIDVVHVASAAIWAGGVMMLGAVAHRRRREGDATRTCELAARFSVVATVALVAAGLAGIVLSVIVADSVSDLWSTSWGRLLLVKVALVAVAAAIGAWNHFVMVPELDQHPEDRPRVDRFAGVLRLEAVVLVCVVVVTGLLVGASTT